MYVGNEIKVPISILLISHCFRSMYDLLYYENKISFFDERCLQHVTYLPR
jgi:hypothetical protein